MRPGRPPAPPSGRPRLLAHARPRSARQRLHPAGGPASSPPAATLLTPALGAVGGAALRRACGPPPPPLPSTSTPSPLRPRRRSPPQAVRLAGRRRCHPPRCPQPSPARGPPLPSSPRPERLGAATATATPLPGPGLATAEGSVGPIRAGRPRPGTPSTPPPSAPSPALDVARCPRFSVLPRPLSGLWSRRPRSLLPQPALRSLPPPPAPRLQRPPPPRPPSRLAVPKWINYTLSVSLCAVLPRCEPARLSLSSLPLALSLAPPFHVLSVSPTISAPLYP